jgi:hypothetical protein
MTLREVFAIIAIAAGWATIFSGLGQVHNIALAVFVAFTVIYIISWILRIFHSGPRTTEKSN